MTYTILSSAYSNPDHTAATIQTAEAGAVMASIEDTVELWLQMLDQGEPAAFVAPVVPVVIAKADLWRRATEIEAEAMDAMLAAQPARVRNIYRDATELHSDDELFPLLSNGLMQLFGASRAVQLLAASA